MSEAYIYDAVRTPRGKGRTDGSLHEVTAARLSALVLNELKSRSDLDTRAVEDVIWGNVTQVKEQGGCLARSAVLASDLDERIPGLSINRFCAGVAWSRTERSASVRVSASLIEADATSKCAAVFGIRPLGLLATSARPALSDAALRRFSAASTSLISLALTVAPSVEWAIRFFAQISPRRLRLPVIWVRIPSAVLVSA